LPKGQEIVSTKGKLKKYDEVYYTKNQPLDTAIPLAVLVNRSSASASEIVSGAMQDLDRGVVVGQRTFGKGLVQTTRPLSYNSQLKLTTAKYYIPSGRCIQALDYSHRNEDGSVGHIPDSLISEFETKNGRIVKDGGGINPDIVVKPESPGKITVSLYAKGLIFDYATQYVIEHKELGDVDDFTVTDEVYRDFIDFLKDKDYDYTTRSDEKLKELIKVAKSEKYFERAEEELTKLKDKLAHDKEKDLLTFQDEIKELLLEEIAGRYHYQEGRIKASLRDDEQLTKAIEILQSKKTYAGILKGQSGNILARK
jgi:carboxyl-terminal processing protease